MAVPVPYIENVRDLLVSAGIRLPTFPQLEPDDALYSVALIQPKGEIVGDSCGVRNSNRRLAIEKLRQFLTLSIQGGVSLRACPEYCCPWEIIDEIVSGQLAVPDEAIWFLGCEAISPEALRARSEVSPSNVHWLFESVEENRCIGQTFLDPLCIITRGYRDSGAPVTVIAVQFKTEPMGGIDFEQKHMIRGACLYELRNRKRLGNHTLS